MKESRDTQLSTKRNIRIAGLVLRRVSPLRLMDALDGLGKLGMRCVYTNQINIAPDEREVFVMSETPFVSEAQCAEANSIIVNLIDSDVRDSLAHVSCGKHGCYEVVDYYRI